MLWSLVSDEPFTVEKMGPYYKYNPAESKKLRIEAGFPDGKVKVPSPLTFSHPTMTLRSTAYQAFFKEEGIEFELDPRDFSTYAPYYYQRAFKDIAVTFLNGDDLTLNWVAQNKFQRDSTQNTALIDDPEIERVVKEIKVSSDPAKLRQYAKFLWDYDTLGSYNIWTPAEQGYSVTQARVRNWALRSGDGFFSQRYMPWLADAPRTTP
jgi:ABC-type transport system substrate-binding protein